MVRPKSIYENQNKSIACHRDNIVYLRRKHRRPQQRSLYVLPPLRPNHLTDDLRYALQIIVSRDLLDCFAKLIQRIRALRCHWWLSVRGILRKLRLCLLSIAADQIGCCLAEIAEQTDQRDRAIARLRALVCVVVAGVLRSLGVGVRTSVERSVRWSITAS